MLPGTASGLHRPCREAAQSQDCEEWGSRAAHSASHTIGAQCTGSASPSGTLRGTSQGQGLRWHPSTPKQCYQSPTTGVTLQLPDAQCKPWGRAAPCSLLHFLPAPTCLQKQPEYFRTSAQPHDCHRAAQPDYLGRGVFIGHERRRNSFPATPPRAQALSTAGTAQLVARQHRSWLPSALLQTHPSVFQVLPRP